MSSRFMYHLEVRHDGLHKYRLIKGTDRDVIAQKAHAQLQVWDEMWEKKTAIDAVRTKREKASQEKEDQKRLASERTEEAQEALAELGCILLRTLNINDRIDWNALLDKKAFSKPVPSNPALAAAPKQPTKSDDEFIPQRRWYYVLFPNLRKKAEDDAALRLMEANEHWLKKKAEIGIKNKLSLETHKILLAKWQKEKEEFENAQAEKNKHVLEKKKSYFERDPLAITEYCDMVLSNSKYPDEFPQEWNIYYQQESRILVIDYFFPAIENLPTLKEVKYIASRNEFAETHLQEAALNKIYDALLYQIVLRCIHEIYESDQLEEIASVVINGWVRSIDKGTGKPITVCVLSVQASREEFLKIDLKLVDPKTCFKTLKGVGSSKLHGLSPIAPILQLDKEDKRFISSYSVAGDVDQTTNLAAMDWEDFEHLIRELFEKEFSSNGGEVKITQASRDGGVDAVAFDPDPIRGGKIVIQAKRYTNVVGVSAVRDLYGTVMNEGATKGILVTTADYGPDAYTFAKGKPLTLLSGANLLHLLEKHGHKAIIDIKAAKQKIADEKAES